MRLVRRPRTPVGWAMLAARGTAAAIVIARLARTASRRPGLVPVVAGDAAAISVVVPARDEATRIGPCLDALDGAPGVTEVLVVDDGSTDATAAIAAGRGARVLSGAPLPPGWTGKAWALHQGIEAASGDWVVALDADTRADPRLPAAAVSRMAADGARFATVAGRFECPTAGLRWLHPAMLTTLVYRFGPPGSSSRPGRVLANGQCMVLRRSDLLAAGGFRAVAAQTVEDVALARYLVARGHDVELLDGTALLAVRMYESAPEAWRGWGRSIALPGVEPTVRQLGDLAVVAATQAAPMLRLLLGRADVLDAVLVLVRVGTLVGMRRAYDRRGPAYWLSPVADAPAMLALALGIVRRRQTWRGRTYA